MGEKKKPSKRLPFDNSKAVPLYSQPWGSFVSVRQERMGWTPPPALPQAQELPFLPSSRKPIKANKTQARDTVKSGAITQEKLLRAPVPVCPFVLFLRGLRLIKG